jgi:putative transcriptional regulator
VLFLFFLNIENIFIPKNRKAKAVRFSTLAAICKTLDCQSVDILEYKSDEET